MSDQTETEAVLPTDPEAFTVAEITEWAATASHEDLAKAMAAEDEGKARTGALAALQAALDAEQPEIDTQATTAKTKDYSGRLLVAPATNGTDFLGRAILAGDKDYLGRALV